MLRRLYLVLGLMAVVAGAIGVVLPLIPTVPFLLLAAFFFARSNPAWERRIVEHPRFGPHVRAWRERGAISPRGKTSAVVALTVSAIAGMVLMETGWRFVPAGVAALCAAWIVSRPNS